MKFKRDHYLRRLFFVEESFQHKARVNLYWLAWLLDQTTHQHQLVLDPMGGAGSILLAATKQRPVLTGDIESHWCLLQAKNALRIQTEMLFSASSKVCQWDATKLPLPWGSVSAIVTSPPYFDLFSNWNRKAGTDIDGNPDHIGETGLCYGFDARQIGNIHIYEDYLRAMRQVYRECWRVLRPGGILVLIVGNKVRNGRIVPVTRDTEVLCVANGFRLIDCHQRETIPSRFRRIHAQNNEDYPTIEVETALVFQRDNRPGPGSNQRLAVVEAPNPNGSPGRMLFEKQILYSRREMDSVLALTCEGLGLVRGWGGAGVPNVVWSGDHPRKALNRREWSHKIVRDLVTTYGLRTWDEVELHVTDRYARYLQQRLTTLGCEATIPTARCNMGQKLAWYTERLTDAG